MMGGDSRSPPFSRQEVGGERPVMVGSGGDGLEGAISRTGEEFTGSLASDMRSWSRRDVDGMEGVLGGQGIDLVDPSGMTGMHVDEGYSRVQDVVSLGDMAVLPPQARPDCEMQGEGGHGDAGQRLTADGGESGSTPVFSFGNGSEFQLGAMPSSDAFRQTASWFKNGSPRVSSFLPPTTGSRKESGPLLINKKQDEPPKRIWTKPVMVRLPAKEPDSGEVVRDDRVQLDEEDVKLTSKRFEAALVGRCFGRRLNFVKLNAELHRRWDGFGSFRLVTINGDCFICFFDTIEGREAVLLGGPWLIAGQVIGVDHWSPEFSPKSKAGFVTHVWVRFPALPMYCWGAKNLVRIAGRLGDPVYMDVATDKLDRGNYARVCVRIDLSLPLRAGMWIDGPHGSFF